MFRKYFYLVSIISSFTINAQAQQWWYGTFINICDNREYFSRYAHSQTILGARLNLGSGFEIDSVNQVFAGINYMIEYGHKPFSNPIPDNGANNKSWNPVIDLYYKYEKGNFKIQLGSFPRYKILNYPLALITDTFQYYRPNIQGGFSELTGTWGKQNVWCDWVSRQTYIAREQFMAGTSGFIQFKNFYIEDYFYMFHNASSMATDTANHIQDNGGFAFYAGYDFNNKTALEVFKIDIGYLGAYNRFRPAPYGSFGGLQFRVFMSYKFAGIDATYYNGQKLPLVNGDPFYSNTGNYARIDAFIHPLKSKHIDSKIGWSFHILDGGKDLDNSFQVLLRVDFLNREK